MKYGKIISMLFVVFSSAQASYNPRDPRLAAWAETDYYQLFNIKPDASAQEIRKAYLNLVKTEHPDKKPGNTENFKKIVAANETLSDATSKAQYDAYRKNLQSNAQQEKQREQTRRREQDNEARSKLPISFELRNKMPHVLKIEVRNGKSLDTKMLAKPVSTREKDIPTFQLKLDQNQPVALDIEFTNTEGKKEHHTYLFPAETAQFITFENGTLRPQKGSWGKSQSGLPIPKNNVTQREIDAKKDVTVLRK